MIRRARIRQRIDFKAVLSKNQDDNLPTKSKTKLSMQEAAEEAREILRSERDEATTNILLEEVRQKTGMGDYAWEHKIIKPLKRDMDAERFKLELLSLLQMSDLVAGMSPNCFASTKEQHGCGDD